MTDKKLIQFYVKENTEIKRELKAEKEQHEDLKDKVFSLLDTVAYDDYYKQDWAQLNLFD